MQVETESKKGPLLEDMDFRGEFGEGAKATPISKAEQERLEKINKLEPFKRKAEVTLAKLEHLGQDLKKAKIPQAAKHEEKLHQLQQQLADAKSEKETKKVIETAELGIKLLAPAAAQALWEQITTETDNGILSRQVAADLSKMYESGGKDNYESFIRSARFEQENLNEHRARWYATGATQDMAHEAQEIGMMLGTIAGKEDLEQQSKRASTLWNDAERAAFDRREYKTAADLGEELVRLLNYLKAERNSLDREIERAAQSPKAMASLVKKPMELAVLLRISLAKVTTTEVYRNQNKTGPVNAAEADRILTLFQGALDWQDPSQLPPALQALGVLRKGWSVYTDMAIKWDKEAAERKRKQQMALALYSLAGESETPEHKQLCNFVVAYLKKLSEAEKIAGGSVESKVLASEAEATAEYNFRALEGNPRAVFEEERKNALVEENEKQAKKGGPAKELKSALDVAYPGELPAKLLQAEQLRMAAEANGVSMPKDMSLAHVIALNMYSTQTDCDKMQAILMEIEKPGVPPLSPEKKEAFLKIIDLAKEGLKKLRPYKGDTQRGEAAWKGAEQQYQVKAPPFTIKQFWSTAFGTGAFSGAYQITVTPKKGKEGGRQIDAFSDHHKENEVLFPPGTTFRVTSRVGELATGVKVSVQEV